MKNSIKRIPVLGDWTRRAYSWIKGQHRTRQPFMGSAVYWSRRYANGGDSGVGSYGKFAEFKAEMLNNFVAQHNVAFVIEFGCGDGNQLSLAKYPRYLGYDISEKAVSLCKNRFNADTTKAFKLLSEYNGEKADMTLSLDVIYHLIEDETFERHMELLFAASERYVAIYSSNSKNNLGLKGTHVHHRKFTTWVAKKLPDWKVVKYSPNRYSYQGDYTTGSWSDLFIYERKRIGSPNSPDLEVLPSKLGGQGLRI